MYIYTHIYIECIHRNTSTTKRVHTESAFDVHSLCGAGVYVYTLYIYVCVYIHTHIYIYVCIYIHMHIYIYAYAYIYIYNQPHKGSVHRTQALTPFTSKASKGVKAFTLCIFNLVYRSRVANDRQCFIQLLKMYTHTHTNTHITHSCQ